MDKVNFLNCGVTITPQRQIFHPKGDILHVLKATDESFAEFGEAYFTTVHAGETKGWKKHTLMTMNIVVPIGEVTFYFRGEASNEIESVLIGAKKYSRITIPPGIWVAFSGGAFPINLVLNVASIPHDPTEAVNVALETFPIGYVE